MWDDDSESNCVVISQLLQSGPTIVRLAGFSLADLQL